ncbi:MAG: ATP-binding cassette domain-containing protein [Patescibacteria group bacterium]
MNSIISVEHLVKHYGDFVAVNDISFNLGKGEFFGFVGPNGAGKTTTINILATLLEPTSGTVSVASFDVTKDKDDVRSSIGIIFQDPSLDLELTAWENLELHARLYGVPKDVFRKRADELLTLVELLDRKNSIVNTFSGGMKRRLEIVRGLLHHPKLLILDEPTIGLDPQTRAYIWRYLKQIRETEEITVFLTTHYLPETEQCDHIAIIDKGSIIAYGTPEELKNKFNQQSMDAVFIEATGHGIRDEELSPEAQARVRHKSGMSWR